MADHQCVLPMRLTARSDRSYRCPTCGRRYVWAVRHIRGVRHERWWRMADDAETRMTQARREMDRTYRPWAVAAAALGLLIVVVLVLAAVWLSRTVS